MDGQLQEIGARVRKARTDSGMTQGQLAEAVGMLFGLSEQNNELFRIDKRITRNYSEYVLE